MIFYIFVWNNYFFLMVKYILFDYKEIVDRVRKNYEYMILFDIVCD